MSPVEVIARAASQYHADRVGGCFSDEEPETVDDCLAGHCPCVSASRAEAAAILAALDAAGLAVAPKEPTDEMQTAGTEEWLTVRAMEDRAAVIYRAMIAAAKETYDGTL
jgi:hypothetical protein